MKCIAKVSDGNCRDVATLKVERNDLSHREGFYCDKHGNPCRAYPKDFIVTEINKR